MRLELGVDEIGHRDIGQHTAKKKKKICNICKKNSKKYIRSTTIMKKVSTFYLNIKFIIHFYKF